VSAALVRFAELSWRLALATLLLLALSGLTGCAARLSPATPIVLELPDVTRDVWNGRGQIVHREPYDDPPLADRDSVLGQAWRAVYKSVSGVDGGMREVSGAFFVPSGAPPNNGWPVISLAHGTVGIGNDCGPSRQPNMQGYGFMIQALLKSKYAVALTDYEGLGESGSHPYLEPRTVAFNTIDAVRAMRNLTANVSARWIAVGYSQGGQAVWAANELNSYYGSGLQLQGSVALAPATNLSAAADLVLSESMSDEQRALFPTVIVGLARFNPDLDAHSFLHESTEAYQKSLSRCKTTPRQPRRTPSASAPVLWQKAVDRLRESNDLRPESPQDVAKLQEVLRRVAVPDRPLEKPMLVISGAHDGVVFPDWVQDAVSRSCALGGQIEYLQADAGHQDILWKVSRPVDRWIADRFAGMAPPSNCPVAQG
jgi:pimeloyl-ACP methyl ester carboxylesterase